jgi:hypothetical protein
MIGAPRTRTDGESGVTAILVLVLITVVAVVSAAILEFAFTGFRTTQAVRGQAATVYGADGAMQTAINDLRSSSYDGTGTCFGGSNTTTKTVAGKTFSVTCAKFSAAGGVPISTRNRPANALLTFPAGGEPGLDAANSSSQPFGIAAGVVINGSTRGNYVIWPGGDAAATPPIIYQSPDLYAQGACSPVPKYLTDFAGTTATGHVHCSNNDPIWPPPVTPKGVHPEIDPNYSSKSVPLEPATLPTCASGNPVTFSPGYYDDAKALNDLTAGSCSKNFWFKPGTYYFDFHNSSALSNHQSPALKGSTPDDVWTINTGNSRALVGGELPTPLGNGNPKIPGACYNPNSRAGIGKQGVQFIFGGDSRVNIVGGKVELCGTYSTDAPPINVFGLKSGSEKEEDTDGGPTKVGNVSKFKPSGGSAADSIKNVDSDAETFVKTGTNSETAKLTAEGFSGSKPPKGSVLVSAKIRVAYSNTVGNNTSAGRTLTVKPAGTVGTTSNKIKLKDVDGSGEKEYTEDVPSNQFTELAKNIRDGSFDGVKLDYEATVDKASTESLNALRLELTYRAPAAEAQSGCVTSGPYSRGGPTAANCSFFRVLNSSNPEVYLNGTFYAPRGVLDMFVHGTGGNNLNFGVIARTAFLDGQGASANGGAALSVPEYNFGFAVDIILNVCPDPGGGPPSPCTLADSSLQSRVGLVDDASRQVIVLSWAKQS